MRERQSLTPKSKFYIRIPGRINKRCYEWPHLHFINLGKGEEKYRIEADNIIKDLN